MNEKTISFLHSGDLGDIVSSLAAVKELCEKENKKAILYLDTSGGTTCNEEPLNRIILMQSQGKGLKFNDSGYEFIRPLLLEQDYVEDVIKWTSDIDLNKIDFNLNRFRISFCNKNIAEKTNQNLMYLHQECCGLKFGWKGAWLKCEKKEFPKKTVICRTCRYHSAEAFFCYLEKQIGEKAYFMGTDLEYAAFCDSFKFPPERINIKTALDAAIVLNSMEQIIVNPTLFYWISVGLGKSLIHEFPLDMPKTTWFQDCPNIKYIQGAHYV